MYKPPNLYATNKNYRRQTLTLGIRFLVKFGKFGVPYFYEFTTESNVTSHIY